MGIRIGLGASVGSVLSIVVWGALSLAAAGAVGAAY